MELLLHSPSCALLPWELAPHACTRAAAWTMRRRILHERSNHDPLSEMEKEQNARAGSRSLGYEDLVMGW